MLQLFRAFTFQQISSKNLNRKQKKQMLKNKSGDHTSTLWFTQALLCFTHPFGYKPPASGT